MLTPNQIPSTGRKTTFQVKQLGFNSVEEFAVSLPSKTVVTDIGAGLSRLGHEVAKLRPDIRWINIDPCYNDKAIAIEIRKDTSPNIDFLAEDIVTGSSKLAQLRGKVDLVYSYWMLPHLSLESDSPAASAASNMYDMLKPNGTLIVGPVKKLGLGFLSPYRYKGTVQHKKSEPRERVAANVVKQTKLWWFPRTIQLLSNRHNVHLGALLVGGRNKEK